MLKLSPKFAEELEKINSRPFALLEIQSRGPSAEATSEADWGAAISKTNVDYTPTPPATGDVILAVDTGTTTATAHASPSSDVSSDYASGGYADIDEYPTANDSDRLVGNGLLGNTNDTYVGGVSNMQDFADEIPPNATIVSVEVYARMYWHTVDTLFGVGHGKAGIRIGGTNYWAASQDPPRDTWSTRHFTWPTNPGTSSAWLISELASIQGIGVYQNTTGVTGNGDYWLCSQLYLLVTYYNFKTSGSITVQLDLGVSANTDNNATVTIDDVVPVNTGMDYELFGVEYMRPTGDYEAIAGTVNNANAYDGDDTDSSTTTKTAAIGDYLFIGRDAGNVDQWETEPAYDSSLSLSLSVTYSRSFSFFSSMGIEIQTSAGVLVGTILVLGHNSVAKTTSIVDVTAYAGDLADLRIVITGSTTYSGIVVDIYDCWITGQIPLGSIQDGSSAPSFSHFRVKVAFSSDGVATPVLKSIGIEIPDRIYRFTSFPDRIFDAEPNLLGIPARSTSISLKDFVTIGSDIKINLAKDEFVTQMLRENYFKNLNASVRMGLYRDDITEEDLVPIYQGTVSGYSVGKDKASISLKDGTKDLSIKWPQGSGTSSPPAVSLDGTHMVEVINTILGEVAIGARYIDRGSLAVLRAARANYYVYRGSSPPVATGDTTITEPETAKKSIGELLRFLGAYMVGQEDGKLHVVEYDSSTVVVGEPWTSDDFDTDVIYNPDVENLKDVFYVYYDWSGASEDAKAFASLLIAPDSIAIANWDETAIEIIKSKWLAGSASDGYYGAEIAAAVGARETLRRKNGMGIFPCKTSLSKFAVQAGDMVDIDASDLIINPDVGAGDTRKFMVVKKTPDWENKSISWSLVEAR